MAADWPLIGRTAELERVKGLLGSRAGGGVVLAGPAGVGKTRLATECLAVAATEGFAPLRAAATASGSALPFGAFATLLPELTPGNDRFETLRQISRAIADHGGGKPIALFVDDAHLLDESSAVLTHQLASGQKAFVLATLRSGEPASDAVVALWKDGLAERLEIQPLVATEVEALLVNALGGTVESATVRQLWERTEGNPLFLRELVLGALEGGALRAEGDVWRLSGTLPPSDRLVEIVEARLAGLGTTDRQALSVLALGEPLGVDLLTAVEPEAALEALERRGLVRLHEDSRRLQARLAHPLYSEVLRSRLWPLRARVAVRALAGATEGTGARRREDVLRVAGWRLQGGGDCDPALMLAGAQQAHARHDLDLAERLAEAARGAGGGFQAGLLLGLVLSQTGRGLDAEGILGPLVAEAGDDTERAVLDVARIENLTSLGRIGEVMAIAEAADTDIKDPAAHAEVAVWRAVVLWLTGQVAEARVLAEPLLAHAEGRALVSACALAGYMFAIAGRVTDAIETTKRGLAAHLAWEGPPLRWTPHIHLHLRCEALNLAGHLAEAEALAGDEYDKAVSGADLVGQGWLSWAMAMNHLAQGRAASAARWGRVAAGVCRDEGHQLQLSYVLVCLAHALALEGKADEAAAVLAEYETIPGSGGQERRVEFLEAQAWIKVAAKDLPAAVELLIEAGALANAQGSFAVEATALHDLARLGRASQVADRLKELVAIVEGPLAPARAAHTAGLLAGDPAGLEAVSADFETMAALLLAAEAAADAAVAWRRAGEPRKAAAAERRAGALAARCEGVRTPALSTAGPARAALSPRELEVARLAAAGTPNKEIAARLFLSLRTVENKLHAAYEKLGVEGRSDLAEALGMPASPPPGSRPAPGSSPRS